MKYFYARQCYNSITTNQMINGQQVQMNESMYGNEVKRRRINQEGDHLKVWQMCEMLYLFPGEWMQHVGREFIFREEEVPEEEEVQEEEVQEVPEVQEVQEVQEAQEVQEVQEVPEVQVQEVQAPMHLIGRTLDVDTVLGRFHGVLVSLFELNGERAIHIETTNGENRIFRTSEIIGLDVLYPEPEPNLQNEEPENEEPENEELQNEEPENEELVMLSPIPAEDEEEDDFPDVQFIRHESPPRTYAVAEDAVADEPNCCAVCLDATDNARNFVSLDCGHQFHFACIMGNMANGGATRNQCPLCRSDIGHVAHVGEEMGSLIQRLQDELDRTREYRADLNAEYARIMQMNIAIGTRHEDERQARAALDRRAYIYGLNERIAAVVASAANNDIRENYANGAAVHFERQILDVCMGFGMMAYDRQYDAPRHYDEYMDEYMEEEQEEEQEQEQEQEQPRVVARREPGIVYINELHDTLENRRATSAVIAAANAAGEIVILIMANGDMMALEMLRDDDEEEHERDM